MKRIKSRHLRAVYFQYESYPHPLRDTFGRTFYLVRETDGSSQPGFRMGLGKWDVTGTMVATFDKMILGSGTGEAIFYTWLNGLDDKSTGTYQVGGHMAAYECNPPPAHDGALLDIAMARASANFNAQLRKFSQRMQGGVFLGEMREAIGMLRRPAASLFEGLGKYISHVSKRNMAENAKRGRRRVRDVNRIREESFRQESVANLTKIAAESWLEYSFGWMPAVNDIQDAMKALNHTRDYASLEHVSAGGQAESSLSAPPPRAAGFKELTWNVNISRPSRCHVRLKGMVRLRPQMSTVDSLKNWGVHTSQWLPTAWELLPWSFLFDYFGNIGDILNYDNSLNSNLVWACFGIKNTTTENVSWIFDEARTRELGGTRLVSCSGSSSFASYERNSISRARYYPSDLTLSDVHLSLPTLPNQWLNMAALLASGNSIHAQRFNSF